jgi:hypothetical protein
MEELESQLIAKLRQPIADVVGAARPTWTAWECAHYGPTSNRGFDLNHGHCQTNHIHGNMQFGWKVCGGCDCCKRYRLEPTTHALTINSCSSSPGEFSCQKTWTDSQDSDHQQWSSNQQCGSVAWLEFDLGAVYKITKIDVFQSRRRQTSQRMILSGDVTHEKEYLTQYIRDQHAYESKHTLSTEGARVNVIGRKIRLSAPAVRRRCAWGVRHIKFYGTAYAWPIVGGGRGDAKDELRCSEWAIKSGGSCATPWEWRNGEKTLEQCQAECEKYAGCGGVSFKTNECLLMGKLPVNSKTQDEWKSYRKPVLWPVFGGGRGGANDELRCTGLWGGVGWKDKGDGSCAGTWDFQGGTKTLEECQVECEKHANCEGVSFSASEKRCILMGKLPVNDKTQDAWKSYLRRPVTCYGELSGLAFDEGGNLGDAVPTSSAKQCQLACNLNPHCRSASLCPGQCWLKNKIFTGSEASREWEGCKTLYQQSCL